MTVHPDIELEVPGLDGYLVDPFKAVVYSYQGTFYKKPLKAFLGSNNKNLVVQLIVRGKRTTRSLALLVYKAYHGLPENTKIRVKHIDGNCLNCSIDNLERDQVYVPLGHSIVLEDSQIIEIRNLYRSGGVTQKQLAQRFGVSINTISSIVHRRKHNHV
jgi:hypothetical protein